MASVIDITGQKFGRLFVVKRSENFNKKDGKAYWICLCDCGNSVIVSGKNLRSGNTKSCGCIHSEGLAKRNIESAKHNGRKERLYQIWQSMLYRCNRKNHPAYKYYGGRGIQVCDEWKEYSKFREWAIAKGYNENAIRGKCTIDRIDVNGGYCPENCRWTTMKTQCNNRRNNRIFEYSGERHTISEWAIIFNIPEKTFRARVYNGWDFDRIIHTPIKKSGR